MADNVSSRVLDLGLNVLDVECDRIYICSAEPTTFTEATSTFALGSNTFGAGNAFGPPAAATPNGRKVTSAAIAAGSVSGNGTASRWAAVDFANSRLLAQNTISPGVAVTAGSAFTLNAVVVTIMAASA